ncbi:hypothetical protein QMT40_001433 [Parvibaculaceae bacterium PLY_AMNH_Bact1]|nr:hypothetical protein QMT40_001433 [Parvibaculaceae bacterium PLY_AMNH_Bact1]
MISKTDSWPGVELVDINELLDAAKAAADIPNDSQLSKKLDTAAGQISVWRKGYRKPVDSMVMRICEVADIPREVGLMWLNAWRADEQAAPVYEKLARDLEKRSSKKKLAA